MKKQDLTPEDLKKTAIAAVTSALDARQLDTAEERLERFGSDFLMLMDDVRGADVFRLASLLADFGASLVEQMSQILDSDPDKVMQFLAQQMMGSSITEGGLDD